MKHLFNIILTVAIITGIIIFINFVNRIFFPNIEVQEVVKVDTVWVIKRDTVIKTKLVPKYVKLPSDTVYIPGDCDSLKVMYKNLYVSYNTEKTFITNDTSSFGNTEITTKILRNNIEELKIIYDFKVPEITVTKEIYPQQCHFYAGLIIQKNGISPNILYIRPKINISLQYDIINKQTSIGVGYKLFSYGKKSK